jgi:hypothetical protein
MQSFSIDVTATDPRLPPLVDYPTYPRMEPFRFRCLVRQALSKPPLKCGLARGAGRFSQRQSDVRRHPGRSRRFRLRRTGSSGQSLGEALISTPPFVETPVSTMVSMPRLLSCCSSDVPANAPQWRFVTNRSPSWNPTDRTISDSSSGSCLPGNDKG